VDFVGLERSFSRFRCVALGGAGVAWGRAVDGGLEDASVKHGERGDEEAEGDAGDGLECEVEFRADEGVDETVHDGDHDDDGDGVDVWEDVVW